ncbi:diol dehydratase reactivase subunit alpha, partial [Listeria monocytogenes]|nr:diol dehydratase reactivase subunit alpha [Listeria monocytogenes]
MKYIAGIDIGNSTTEVALAMANYSKEVAFVASAITDTTGIKGTKQNLHGIFKALRLALEKVNATTENLAEIRINEATPVIGDVAMETITETIITESTMIGHNPKTPGGLGMGSGVTVLLDDVTSKSKDEDYIVIIPKTVDFEDAAKQINTYVENGYQITA